MRKSVSARNKFSEWQLEEAWSSAVSIQHETSGEERLALHTLAEGIIAVIEPALCMLHGRQYHTGGKRKLKPKPKRVGDPMLARQQEALKWVEGAETDYPFQAVCSALMLDTERMRNILLYKLKQLQKQIQMRENAQGKQ
jgi:hypothetical protein